MRRPSIARLLLLALVGLTLALGGLAALSIGALYGARQDYEDALARAYAGEVAAANLLAADVVQTAAPSPAARRAHDRAVATLRRTAAGDAASERLARRAGSRAAVLAFAERQAARRAAARDRVQDRTRTAVITAAIAGLLAVAAAIALVTLLVGSLRRPLDDLVGATRRLAGGDTGTRVDPAGPAELQGLATAFNAMAGDLEGAYGSIEAGRRRLAAVIESLGDALVICDGHGRVVEVNPRAAELVPSLTPGTSVATDPGPLPDLEDALGREVEVEDAEGRTLSITAARMGETLEDGVVFTVRDATERARLDRAKSEFVATASHELRSPLTSIKGFVELLGQTELAERQRGFVDIILLSTNRLVDLVNDLLDVARVEAGQLEIQRRPISVAEAAREVAAMMAPQFEQREQSLDVEIAPALPAALADPSRVRQIVTNLLTNAHLYSGQGGRVTLRVGATDADVVLSVRDSGQGMTADQLDRAFDRFYRADGSRGTGTGLGLAIVQSLVELHHGSIDISSEVGEGTTVTVRLPREPGPGDADRTRAALRGRRVLVVDADADTARSVAGSLERHGVATEVAADGEAALALLRGERFDAVTMDLQFDGVLPVLRADPSLAAMPVIVMSGEETPAAEWSVAKPVDGDELVGALGAAILAGRSRVLVVGRPGMREKVAPLLDEGSVDYAWATSAAEAGRMCEETHFEVALVDAGMRAPQAALAQLDLRGRRRKRSIVVFSTDAGDDNGAARLDPAPVALDEAARVVFEALGR